MIDFGLYARTLSHLRRQQVLYQVLNRLRRFTERGPALRISAVNHPSQGQRNGNWLTTFAPDKPVSYEPDAFTFLNLTHSFGDQIDWNWAGYGKLWTYNLTYFDFLNQSGMTADSGLRLIREFMAKTNSLRDALEPYPISLRLMNWIRFLSYHQIQDNEIDAHLRAQMTRLRQRLEFHLGGNHLLENAYALTYASLYFRLDAEFWYATRLLRTQLSEQILADGGHDERSPMYHQILLDRLLELLLAIQSDRWVTDTALQNFLNQTARHMLSWLHAITFDDGTVPLVNDAATGIAPTTTQLRRKANQLLQPILADENWKPGQRRSGAPDRQPDTGYRLLGAGKWAVFADVGLVGPDHQPGHAHADTLSFVLYIDGKPVLVDTGTSTYQIGPRRTWERSTAAHNTVTVNGQDSSEVWGGFRVGRRARVIVLTDTPDHLVARHNGYQRFGVWHQRSWQLSTGQLTITDELLTANDQPAATAEGTARFYVHPGLSVILINDTIMIEKNRFTFTGDLLRPIQVDDCQIADGFNQLLPAQCVQVLFKSTLNTSILIG